MPIFEPHPCQLVANDGQLKIRPSGFLVELWISFVVYQIPRKAKKIASVDVFLEMDALPHEKKGVCVISRVLLSQSDIGII